MSRLFPDPFEVLRTRLLMRAAHRHGLPLREANRVSLLGGGDAILEATLALIRGAQRELRFEMYLWNDDAVGHEVQAALAGALARGVQVRGLLDAIGSRDAKTMVEELLTAGADLRWFHPVSSWRPRLWNRRNHCKVIIADGAELVMGSANWGLDYRPAENRAAFLDLGMALRGPSIADVVADFAEAWRRTSGAPPPPMADAVGEEPFWAGPWHGGAQVQVISSLGRGGRRRMRRHLRLLLSRVQRELLIANAYFIPTILVLRRLKHLATRGCRVVLLLPGASDQPFVQAASRHIYGSLLASGIRIFEREGIMLHAKAALLDGETLLVGSANLDSRSFRLNLELNLLVRQPELVAEARQLFEEQLRHSVECTSTDWSHRPWWLRTWSWLAYRFRGWL